MDAARRLQERRGREVRVLQPSSAEIFGEPATSPQDERTPIRPVSPYGASKAFAHHVAGVERVARPVHARRVILYNHESPRRPTTVRHPQDHQHGGRDRRRAAPTASRWATSTPAATGAGPRTTSTRWCAPCAHDVPGDYVVATGRAHSVRDFVAAAFEHAGITDWEPFVEVHTDFIRPADPSLLVGDASAARERLGWSPTVTFEDLVGRMVDAEEPTS